VQKVEKEFFEKICLISCSKADNYLTFCTLNVKIKRILERVKGHSSLSKAIVLDHSVRELRPYGQPGPLPNGGHSLPLLIELKARIL
jgi:hypothetical protein